MPLPHFTNIQSHFNNWEPIHKNLYEVTVILPPLIQGIHPESTILLLENIKSIGLPAYKELPPITQRFKYSTRKFLGVPEDTSTTFNMVLNMNQNEDYQIFTWRIMKDWYDLGWNNEDGTLHYKRNMIGDVIIHLHDKEGHVIRRITYHNCQLNQITGFDESITWDNNSDVFELTANFVADYWEDYYL